MIKHTTPPSCDRTWISETDEWRIDSDCGDSSCASSTTHSAAGDRP